MIYRVALTVVVSGLLAGLTTATFCSLGAQPFVCAVLGTLAGIIPAPFSLGIHRR